APPPPPRAPRPRPAPRRPPTAPSRRAHLFAAEITDGDGADDTEQTWAEITIFGEIRESVSWTGPPLGMIAEAVPGRAFPPLASSTNHPPFYQLDICHSRGV